MIVRAVAPRRRQLLDIKMALAKPWVQMSAEIFADGNAKPEWKNVASSTWIGLKTHRTWSCQLVRMDQMRLLPPRATQGGHVKICACNGGRHRGAALAAVYMAEIDRLQQLRPWAEAWTQEWFLDWIDQKASKLWWVRCVVFAQHWSASGFNKTFACVHETSQLRWSYCRNNTTALYAFPRWTDGQSKVSHFNGDEHGGWSWLKMANDASKWLMMVKIGIHSG